MTISTEHAHIIRDDQIFGGEPIIRGTRTPVRAIVEIWQNGIPAEQIKTHLPHLSLAQIFDALSYFADHQQEINTYIQRNLAPQPPRTQYNSWLTQLIEFSKNHSLPSQEIDLNRDRLFEELHG